MVAADIADETEPTVGIIGDRAADAILVDSTRTTQTEVGIADGNVDGLRARRNREEQKPQAQEDQLFHSSASFRAKSRVRHAEPIARRAGRNGRSQARVPF